MDNHEQLKTSLSGHGSHEIHLCSKCGWPFPNPHPSARHRRAHKKVCGTIEGYNKLPVDSEGRTHLDVSDDDQHSHSDEDHRTPSPNSEKRSTGGGIKDMSHTTSFGDDVFADAATEFSNNPAVEDHSKGVTESDKIVDKNPEAGFDVGQALKVDSVEDLSKGVTESDKIVDKSYEAGSDVGQALEVDSAVDITKPLDDSSKSSAVCDPIAIETATITPAPLKEISTEEVGIPLISKSEIPMDSSKDEDVKGNGENDILDKVSINVAKVSRSETMYQDASEADLQLAEYVDVKASDLMKVEDTNHVSVKPEVESVEQLKGDSVGVCDTVGEEGQEKNENFHVLSVANDFPIVDQPEVLIQDFKDHHHEAVKSSNLVMSLDNDLPRESESVENEGATLEATPMQSDAANTNTVDIKEKAKEDVHLLSSEGTEVESGKEKCATNIETNPEDSSPSQVSELLPSVDSVPDSTSTKVELGTSDLGSIAAQTHSTSLKCQVDDDDDYVSREVVTETKSGIGATDDVVPVVDVSTRNSDKSVCVEEEEEGLGNLQEESGIAATKTTTTTNGTSVENQVCDDDKLPKHPNGASAAVDLSVDSASQTDSLDANWGSVSVISVQSDAPVSSIAEGLPSNGSQVSCIPKLEDDESGKQKQEDIFDPPSFMTLVTESEGSKVGPIDSDINNNPNAEALKSGWIPSITNVVNESQGRKKNEEIIAKVTNWSTTGMGKQQQSNLKNLLTEADSETKPKPPPTLEQDKNGNKNKTNDNGSDTEKVTAVECAEDQVVKKETEYKEWNSPARYPIDSIKKEKKKAKSMWVPFMCCSSSN